MNKTPALNDYVLATKYSDGNPQDDWCIGFYKGVLPKISGDRYEVADYDGNLFRGNGFRRVKKINKERGEFILRYKKEVNVSGRSLWWWAKVNMALINESLGKFNPTPEPGHEK